AALARHLAVAWPPWRPWPASPAAGPRPGRPPRRPGGYARACVRYGILGPLEVSDRGRRVDLGARRQRAVLAVLLVHGNEVVALDRLIEELWGGTAPNAATASLQAYVSNLRRVLEPDRPPRS